MTLVKLSGAISTNNGIQKTIGIESVQIPDLWHVAMLLKDKGLIHQSEQVLDAWHIAHDLKNHISQ